jgi:hypothetical protein
MLPQITRLTETPYHTVAAAEKSLRALEALFRRGKDNRGLFVIAYAEMTTRIKYALLDRPSPFNEPAWVTEYLLAFANLYREALHGFVTGAIIPAAWRIAFERAADDRGVISLQHLLLGINAHIGHDLPLSLQQVGLGQGETQQRRYADHLRVNEILKAATDSIQDKVTRFHLSQGFSLLEKIIGPFDEELTNYFFERQRTRAWYNGLHLACLSSGASIDSQLADWFRWALQSDETVTDARQLRQRLDQRAFQFAADVILRWKLPSIPGFKDDETFEAFEPTLSDAKLAQLARDIEQQRNLSAAGVEWNWSEAL